MNIEEIKNSGFVSGLRSLIFVLTTRRSNGFTPFIQFESIISLNKIADNIGPDNLADLSGRLTEVLETLGTFCGGRGLKDEVDSLQEIAESLKTMHKYPLCVEGEIFERQGELLAKKIKLFEDKASLIRVYSQQY